MGMVEQTFLMLIEQVEPALFPMLANWQRECTMEDILTQLKKEMMSPQNRKLTQPAEGDYPVDLLSYPFIFEKFILYLPISEISPYRCGTCTMTKLIFCEILPSMPIAEIK